MDFPALITKLTKEMKRAAKNMKAEKAADAPNKDSALIGCAFPSGERFIK
jgi:excinuclease UvrABC nuclease subunit